MTASFSIQHTLVTERRAQIRRAAGVMGINEAHLSIMVDDFYARIRSDERLGPIFDTEIQDNWDEHLDRMKRFWASVALNAGSYSGKPVVVHKRLRGVTNDDFDRWLALFQDTLDDTAPTPEAANYLMFRAERIARSLRMAMFERTEDGVPSLS
ncbi:group III truncated hemoglobin [Aliiroseovarius sediminis]|uniref:group III truncated hemoglobin n=1 Tax=Aliiroseovarius sediminis TaxID=2925839 RepID=UPI001F58F746|nr:group III truncated hemoglobin [Aliiroseovarius sediminis]MCI2393635.1 group III truncated hemoglobin [Aliiroseovarius sediminis]